MAQTKPTPSATKNHVFLGRARSCECKDVPEANGGTGVMGFVWMVPLSEPAMNPQT